MNNRRKYVCAFPGRRDYYQLPLALAEAGMLDRFITDRYFTPPLRALERALPAYVRKNLRFRYDSRLPDDRISCLWRTTMIEHLRHGLGMAALNTITTLDRDYSVAAAARARKSKSDLFLYHPYAWEAFRARYDHTPRRVLFQFHPHPDLERRILRDDAARYPAFHHSYEKAMGDMLSDKLRERTRDVWRYADQIVCASTLTKRSLIEAGANPDVVEVAPYGIDIPSEAPDQFVSESFQALFVGWGIQQKGVHHLLLAWQKAALPATSRLTLVCREIDKGVEDMISRSPSTRLIRGVTENELNHLFRTSSLFVMPSLVEGFGQVFLEALAHGCPVLGTPNTCLPDLGLANGAIFQVEPGGIDQLIAELESLSRKVPGDVDVRRRARECASRWPWARFREKVRAVAAA